MEPTEAELIYTAWRESEAYQVPMTDEGLRLSEHRWQGFLKGWEYATRYRKTGSIYPPEEDFDVQEPIQREFPGF